MKIIIIINEKIN